MVITLKKDRNGKFMSSSEDVISAAVSNRPVSKVLSNEPVSEGPLDIFDMLARGREKKAKEDSK